jgi:hypothetical protein
VYGREFALQDAVPFGLQHGADSGRAEILAKEWIVSAWAAWRRYGGRTDSCIHLNGAASRRTCLRFGRRLPRSILDQFGAGSRRPAPAWASVRLACPGLGFGPRTALELGFSLAAAGRRLPIRQECGKHVREGAPLLPFHPKIAIASSPSAEILYPWRPRRLNALIREASSRCVISNLIKRGRIRSKGIISST